MSVDTVKIEMECRAKALELDQAVRRSMARQKVIEEHINLMTQIVVSHMTAPWVALAENIRSSLRRGG